MRDDCAIGAETVFNFCSETIESLAISLPALDQVIVLNYRSPDSNIGGKDCNRSTNKEISIYLTQLRQFNISLPSPTPNLVMMGHYMYVS